VVVVVSNSSFVNNIPLVMEQKPQRESEREAENTSVNNKKNNTIIHNTIIHTKGELDFIFKESKIKNFGTTKN